MKSNTSDTHAPIPRFPTLLLSISIIITIASMIWVAFYVTESVKSYNSLISRDFRALELRGEITRIDEILTMSARMSASTGDLHWENRYNKYDLILVNAINEASTLVPQDKLAAATKKTNEANQKLVSMERQAFEFAKQGNLKKAQAIFNQEYDAQKLIYSSGMDEFADLLKNQTQINVTQMIEGANYSLIFIFVALLFSLPAWYFTHKNIVKWKLALESSILLQQAYQTKLQEAHNSLERRVQQRTDELNEKNIALNEASIKASKLHDQLVIAARRAGMADISTSVVHNIGNVLNSINVSVTQLEEINTHSKLTNLHELTTLLNQHKDHLGEFLEKQNKGNDIVEYFNLLTTTLSNEHDLTLIELRSVHKNIQHIKNIITTQQSMSGKLGMPEEIELSTLIEDAICMHTNAIKRQNIKIIRDYQFASKVTADKVSLLQIIVNLIKNSIESLSATNRHNKELIIRIHEDGATSFVIQICDNGLGIAADVAKNLFSYGFSTKKDGHGFGLHMSAITAKEMGGTLDLDMDKSIDGATFTLVLPKIFQDKHLKTPSPA